MGKLLREREVYQCGQWWLEAIGLVGALGANGDS